MGIFVPAGVTFGLSFVNKTPEELVRPQFSPEPTICILKALPFRVFHATDVQILRMLEAIHFALRNRKTLLLPCP
jgi:hypothetical protein